MKSMKKDPKSLTKSRKKVQATKKTNTIEEESSTAAFNWFPGHMMKALRDIRSKVAMVDLVLEIRDARVPLVSGSAVLTEAIGGKSRLILLNKANLADQDQNQRWAEYFEKHKEHFLFINCLDRSSIKEVINKARAIIEEKRKQCSGDDIADKEKYKFMVVGLPNTGKSTLINSLANRNATKVANKPGQTQNQIWVKVDEKTDLLDTPGVMPTKIEKEIHKTWLSIINAIPDHIAGEETPACFLIEHFLKNKNQEFLERYKFESLENVELVDALDHIAKVRGCLQKGGPDYDRVYKLLLVDFRAGLLGGVTLETEPVASC